MSCKHEDFAANVDVNRLQDSGRFMADIRITCDQCQTPFHYIGILERGLLQSAPSISPDGIELHVPIGPGHLEIEGPMRYEFPRDVIRLRSVAKLANQFLKELDGMYPHVTPFDKSTIEVLTQLRAALKEVQLL